MSPQRRRLLTWFCACARGCGYPMYLGVPAARGDFAAAHCQYYSRATMARYLKEMQMLAHGTTHNGAPPPDPRFKSVC